MRAMQQLATQKEKLVRRVRIPVDVVTVIFAHIAHVKGFPLSLLSNAPGVYIWNL